MKSHAPSRLVCRLPALLVGLLALAPAVGADAVTLFFDGTVDGEISGISEASALSSGLDILTLPTFSSSGVIDVIDQTADGTVIGPIGTEVPDPFEVTSTWTVESLMQTSAVGDLLLLFAAPLNVTVDTNSGMQSTMYDLATEVGLSVDAAEGWVIVRDVSGSETAYYVGITLGNLLESLGATTMIDVNYHLIGPDQFPIGGDAVVPLPMMMLRVAQVPEPGTGLLLGLGLLGLGVKRRLQ